MGGRRGAEQVRLQELVDDGGEVEDGTLHRTAGNLRLVRLAGSEQLGTGARRPAGLLAWCILDPALLARLHDLEQLAEGVEALGEARVGVKLHRDFLGFTQGQARIQPTVQRGVEPRHVAAGHERRHQRDGLLPGGQRFGRRACTCRNRGLRSCHAEPGTRQRRPDLYDQWCATHPITQIPRWKRTERAQLIKTDAQLDAAAKLFAEGCCTVCRDVCTEAGLAEYTPEIMRQRLEEERKAGWAFYLHTTSDTPDGMVGVCHKTGEIGHLFVTQSARGSGIGTKLLDFARKKLAEHARPWLAVLDVNTAAIGLYRRMGYLPDGVRNMYQPGVDVAFCKPCKELVMRYQPQDQG